MSSGFNFYTWGLIVLILGLVGSIFLFFYTVLVRREEKVKESWSQISFLYQKEIELIPPLLSVINEYARKEQEMIDTILSARTRAQELIAQIDGMTYPSKKKIRNVQETEGLMQRGLHQIDVLKKEYPLLQSHHYYLTIENELRASQDCIKAARHRYNHVAQEYNHGLHLFPLNVITSLFHFEQKTYFTETN